MAIFYDSTFTLPPLFLYRSYTIFTFNSVLKMSLNNESFYVNCELWKTSECDNLIGKWHSVVVLGCDVGYEFILELYINLFS